MPTYHAPVRDIQFVLHDVLDLSTTHPDLDPAFTEAILTEAAKLSEEVLTPLNASGDKQGCRLENGVVRTPDGFQAAFDAMREGGWTALDCAEEYGGQGLPYLLHTAVGEMFVSANMAFNMYQGLTHGAYNAILHHGTDEQKQTYLPKLASCEWTGTMNLTEPHAGTDLGIMRTRAEPQGDDSYRITGTKIFISSGDHDLADNIIHLVLAKAPGGGEGTRGVSLFIVPKLLDGAPNGVTVGKVEEKMGIHGNSTCVMNFDGAKGWLLGGLHKGMKGMFTMMNEARLGVALQGYAVAEPAYQNAVAYARERLQGRAIPSEGKGEADPIIVHPDIRRMLMDQKSFLEGARAFTFWGASLIDKARTDPEAEALVSLLTPVLKGFQTDMGYQCATQAQQVFGGHGYIEETGMSQFVRDARIAMIYEGSNGIQALDLVGRKLGLDGGKPVMAFFEMIKTFCRENDGEDMAGFVQPLKAASKDLQTAAMYFMENMRTPNTALAGSYDFMHMMGHVCLGFMWARMARAALGREGDFYAAKLATGRYYMARQLPATAMHLARIKSGQDPVMALHAEAF